MAVDFAQPCQRLREVRDEAVRSYRSWLQGDGTPLIARPRGWVGPIHRVYSVRPDPHR